MYNKVHGTIFTLGISKEIPTEEIVASFVNFQSIFRRGKIGSTFQFRAVAFELKLIAERKDSNLSCISSEMLSIMAAGNNIIGISRTRPSWYERASWLAFDGNRQSSILLSVISASVLRCPEESNNSSDYYRLLLRRSNMKFSVWIHCKKKKEKKFSSAPVVNCAISRFNTLVIPRRNYSFRIVRRFNWSGIGRGENCRAKNIYLRKKREKETWICVCVCVTVNFSLSANDDR